MHTLQHLSGTRRKHFLRATRLATLAISILAAIIGTATTRAKSQPQNISADKPALEYDVASIKPVNFPVGTNVSGRIGISHTPDGFVAKGVTVKTLILRAYAVDTYQLSGATDWVSKERYDIDAKLESTTADELKKLNSDGRILARQQMLQKLLAERFNLTIHREDKEVQVYYLIAAKNGPKLQETKPDEAGSDKFKGNTPSRVSTMVVGLINAQGVPIATLTAMLTRSLHRPVLDKTGLTGEYDFTLHWTPDESPAQLSTGGSPNGLPLTDPNPNPNAGPSLFTALQEQLGLKLESSKGPVEFIVIDRVERPSGN